MENQNMSILVAAVIIAGSIIYTGVSLKSSGGIDTGTTQPAAVAAQTTDIKVKARSNEATEGTGKLVVYEFSDFQCPFCERFWTETYPQIKAKYIDTGKITFIYRNYPLSFHQNAQIAAEAGECANLQGKFWQYHDRLFGTFVQDGSNLTKDKLKSYALSLGLNTTTFNSCLDNGTVSAAVKADLTEGVNIGITGTPTFIIGGTKLVGSLPFSDFEKAIEAALK